MINLTSFFFNGLIVSDLLHRYDGSYTKRVVDESFDLLNQLWPYVVGGIVFSTIVKLYISKKWFVTFFEKNSNMSLLLAGLLGVLSPLGSYVVIPLAASLIHSGVPVYVLMTFLVSSPLINPSLFFITTGAFGWEMAVARVLAAIIIGFAAGYMTKWMLDHGKLNIESIVKENYKLQNTNAIQVERNTVFTFVREIGRFAIFISKYFFLAILLSAVIKVFLSPSMVNFIFTDNSFLSVLIATGAGIPFYVCGGAAIPVVQQLAELGLGKGAVLAYFISGPITKISNLVVMNAAFNFKLFLIYIGTGLIGAIVLGFLYNFT